MICRSPLQHSVMDALNFVFISSVWITDEILIGSDVTVHFWDVIVDFSPNNGMSNPFRIFCHHENQRIVSKHNQRINCAYWRNYKGEFNLKSIQFYISAIFQLYFSYISTIFQLYFNYISAIFQLVRNINGGEPDFMAWPDSNILNCHKFIDLYKTVWSISQQWSI